jgi:hypothetical protein
MKAKRLKEILANVDDEFEIFVRNSVNPCGNIQELEQAELSTYGFFGSSIPCLILNTDSSKKLETNEEDKVIDLILIK